LTYCLKTKQTPECNYAESDWVVEASGGPSTDQFYSIISDSSGVYFKINPTTNREYAGEYTVEITKVVVDSNNYGTGTSYTPLVAPSSFDLNI